MTEEERTPSKKCVSVVGLKRWARALPHSPLRDLLISEKDRIDAGDFVVKVGVWLKLLDTIREGR